MMEVIIMSLLTGTVSLWRHRVVGTINGSSRDVLDDNIKANIFHHVDDGSIVGKGWVSIHDLTDTEFQEPYWVGPFVGLSLRIDTKRVSSRTVAVALKDRIRRFMENNSLDRVTPSQRREFKEVVTKELRDQAPATIQTIDLVWDTSKATAYSTATNIKSHDVISDYFNRTFGLDLVPVVPFVAACSAVNGHKTTEAYTSNPLDAVPSMMMDLRPVRFI